MIVALEKGNLIIPLREFTLVGESHNNSGVYANLVLQLMESGRFSKLYMEGVDRGVVGDDYREQAFKLINPKFNPQNYVRVIGEALERGVEVHGIEVAPPSRLGRSAEVMDQWATYILSTKGNLPCLIWVGASHAMYGVPPHRVDDYRGAVYEPTTSEDTSLSFHLGKKGVPRSDMLIISEDADIPPVPGIREGLFGIGSNIQSARCGEFSGSPSIRRWAESRVLEHLMGVYAHDGYLTNENLEREYRKSIEELPYHDEASYITWIKRQGVVGEPMLDYFSFPPNSEPSSK